MISGQGKRQILRSNDEVLVFLCFIIYTDDTDDTAWCNWQIGSKSEVSDSYWPPFKRQEPRGGTKHSKLHKLTWGTDVVGLTQLATARRKWLGDEMKLIMVEKGGSLSGGLFAPTWWARYGQQLPSLAMNLVAPFCWWSWRTKDDSVKMKKVGGWDIL